MATKGATQCCVAQLCGKGGLLHLQPTPHLYLRLVVRGNISPGVANPGPRETISCSFSNHPCTYSF